MAKAQPILTNFTSGELSPRLEGRTDYEKYFNGARVMENMITMPHGGATMRPGTYYVAEAKDSTKKIRVVSFEFSTTQAYILEFGDCYIRFYKDQGQILSGLSAYEITTTYAESELFQLQFVQSADYLYIAHPSHAPAKLTRASHTSWTLSDIVTYKGTAMTVSGISKANPAVVTVSALNATVANGDSIYITGVSGMTEVNGKFFIVANINTGAKTFELSGINSSSYSAYTSGGTAQDCQFGSTGNCPACVCFFEERLCWASTNNKPQTITCSVSGDYENYTTGTDDDDALIYTINAAGVQRIRWMVPQDFMLIGTVKGEWRFGGSSKDDPITPTSVSAKQQSTRGSANIQAILVNDCVLFVNRNGRRLHEMAYNFEKDGYLAPDLTIRAEHITKGDPLSSSGITCLAYQSDPDSIAWVVRADGTLLGMTYDRAQDVVGWHRHPTGEVEGDQVESVAVIPGTSEDEVWISTARTVDGNTKRYIEYFKPREFGYKEDAYYVDCGLSWEGEEAVLVTNISQASTAVVTAPGHVFTAGMYVRFADVEGMDEVNDEVYTVANPSGDTFELSGVDSRAFTAFTGGGTVEQVAKTFSGLDHLEGRSVAVCADGAAEADYTVASGSITLADYNNKVHIGLPYSGKIQPMKLDAGGQQGSAQGQTKKIDSLIVRFYESINCQAGPDEDTLKDLDFENDGELYSGDIEIPFPGDYETSGNLIIVQDYPLPMTVLAIMPSVTTYERT